MVPDCPEAITAAWLNAELESVAQGARAQAVEVIDAHSGTTGRARLRVTWEGGDLPRDVFAKLNRTSPLGAPVLINAGRGGLQSEADILACLDDGTLGGASLDVFVQEPVPPDSAFWTHPKVVLTPHNAADTDADAISVYVAEQIARFEAGGALDNVVDRARGY